jgi:AcrR family transcriptional regulator
MTRDLERTRERLLQAAFREVHRSGFQSAGIDAILAATNVTKGALYYHFDGKEAWDLPSSKRRSQNLRATGGCVLC